MDWEKYAKKLEDIISRIDLSEGTQALVDFAVNEAKEQCQESS